MNVSSKALMRVHILDVLPELSPAAKVEVAAAVIRLTDKDWNAKELQRTHIREWLPRVSLDTLKAISALINAEMGIPENDTKVEGA